MPAGAGELDNCLVAHFDCFNAARAIFLAGCDRSILEDCVEWRGETEEERIEREMPRMARSLKADYYATISMCIAGWRSKCS